MPALAGWWRWTYPSGADADAKGEPAGTLARADAILTFTAPRPAHLFGCLTEGPTLVMPIGSPETAIVSLAPAQCDCGRGHRAPDRPPTSGDEQREFWACAGARRVGGEGGIGGHGGHGGAARGRRVVDRGHSQNPCCETVAGFHPEVMTEPLEETEAGTISKRSLGYGHLDALALHKTVLAVGPGISRHVETAEVVRTMVKKYQTPLVLDADGLNAFEGRTGELNGHGRWLVITPHPGEMARLTGSTVAAVQEGRLQVARKFSREHEVIVVLKGHRTLIALPDGTAWVNTTGNPGMATGGTGDILTGMDGRVHGAASRIKSWPRSRWPPCTSTAWPAMWRRKPWGSTR